MLRHCRWQRVIKIETALRQCGKGGTFPSIEYLFKLKNYTNISKVLL